MNPLKSCYPYTLEAKNEIMLCMAWLSGFLNKDETYGVYYTKIKITEVFPFVFKKHKQILSSSRVPLRRGETFSASEHEKLIKIEMISKELWSSQNTF